MQNREYKSRARWAALTAVVFAGSAHAAGFALMEQNASGLGNAYAGQAAAAEDASTIFFNPAGMVRLPGRQIVAGGNFVRPKLEFNDRGSTNAFGLPGPDGGDAGDLGFIPHGYLSWEVVPPGVWVGVGVGAPFGLKTDYDEDWVGGFFGTRSEVKTININPSIAWKVNETVSIGFGLNFQRFEAELSQMVPIVPPVSLEGTVEGDDWGWGWNAGVLINLSPSTRIGIAYRSKIDYDLEGKFKGIPGAEADIEADLELPDSLSVALSHQVTPKLQVLADYTWTGWDSIKEIAINRKAGGNISTLHLDMHDTWRIGVGMNYRLNDTWKLRAGMAFDRAAIRHGRTPRLPDEDRLWFAVGAQWAPNKTTAIDFGYAYLRALGDASINLDGAPTAARLVGDYDANVHIVGIQARYAF